MKLFLGYFQCILQMKKVQILAFTVNTSFFDINPDTQHKTMFGVTNQPLMKYISVNGKTSYKYHSLKNMFLTGMKSYTLSKITLKVRRMFNIVHTKNSLNVKSGCS